MYSSNGGTSWTNQTTSYFLEGIWMQTSTKGWAVGSDETIVATTNGADWSEQTSGTKYYLRDVVFSSATTGWAVGNNGCILHTENGGTLWQNLTSSSGTTENLIAMDVATHVFAVGAHGTILYSSTGDSFTTQSGPVTNTLHSVSMVGNSKVWVVAWGGQIEYTGDGGGTIPEFLFVAAPMLAVVAIALLVRKTDE